VFGYRKLRKHLVVGQAVARKQSGAAISREESAFPTYAVGVTGWKSGLRRG
jgi:hypothetical protein